METVTEKNLTHQIRPAGLWSRFWANAIDGMILGIPILSILILIYMLNPSILFNLKTVQTANSVSSHTQANALGNTLFLIFITTLSITYSVYLTVKRGATWGKDAYGLQVVKYKTTQHIKYKHAIIRDLVKAMPGISYIPILGALISFIVLLINVFLIFFGKEKRTIHDRIAGTQVIKASKPWTMGKQLKILLPLFIVSILLSYLYLYSYSFNALKLSKNNLGNGSQNSSSMFPSINSAERQFAQANNTWRASGINAILNSVNQYMAENNGKIPSVITTSEQQINKAQADLCGILVPAYIAALPSDPKINNNKSITDCNSSYSTGYTIFKDTLNKITVKAPNAELGEKIQVTR